jgi:hypothetical protein
MGTLSDFADLQVRALERSSYFQKVITSTVLTKNLFWVRVVANTCWNTLPLNEVFLSL